MQRVEGAQCLRFDHVVAVSPEDAAVVPRSLRRGAGHPVPTGVDTEFFPPAAPCRAEPALDRLYRIDGLDAERGRDDVLRAGHSASGPTRRSRGTLTVVGRNPTTRVRALAEGRSDITVTGTVPDVRPFLESASVVVVPLRIGGGTRIKIYEAMGMERAVVSTTIGAEGLDVVDGEHILLADDPQSFADAVIGLLHAPERAEQVGRQAALTFGPDFGWAAVAEQFADRCVAAASRRDRPSPRHSP